MMHVNGARGLWLFVGCAGLILLAGGCRATTDAHEPTQEDVARLFSQWNDALQTGMADKVVELYAPNAILLPTVSNKVRHNSTEIKDYFAHFLESKPIPKINEQNIRVYGPVAVNSGIYTFTLTRDGKPDEVRARYTFVYHRQKDRWLIVEHHSSAMPEGTTQPAQARQ